MAVELRVRVTVAGHGYDPENGERFLEGFLQTHPESHPVVTQNTAEGTLTVTFTVEAATPSTLLHLRRGRFSVMARAHRGLPATDVLDVNISVGETEGRTVPMRQLQPA